MAVPALVPPKHPDEWGAALAAITTILGLFGVAERLGLTGDQMTVALGSLATLAAIVRAAGRRWLAARGQ
jgi:hypothetical protein